ncbi:MAG: 2-dehydropantoate 2-reductase [Flavobacteriaceae bacterium]|nr:2-dehydropantoate 2-reductase [Flavobacteriaceae bacterium]
MNIVVVGAGGVGGYFGGRLAEAGHDVTFLLRSNSYNAIKSNGLSIKSPDGDFNFMTKVAKSIEELGLAELIILGVKSWQVEEVAKILKPIITPATMVLPLQNGANITEKLTSVLNPNNVLAGFCKIIAKKDAPGKILHMGAEPEIVLGEINNERTKRIEELENSLNLAKFKVTVPENIHLEIWKKYLFITTISGLGGLTRAPLGVLRSDQQLRRIMQSTADEIIEIAQKKNIPLTKDHRELVFHFIDKLKPETTSSVQRDIMAGRPSELEDFNGYIVKEGERLQISTPTNYFIYNCLRPMEMEARKSL